MKPDFIGIGAQKSGTSWIYACLDDHPGIHVPIKELHFFSKDEVYERGLDWYCNRFAQKLDGQVTGEFSTTYLHSDIALKRIASAFPDVKVIVSIRDPIERARSHFDNDIKAGLIDKDSSPSDTMLANSEYIARGYYCEKIRWLLKTFGRENILVLILEDSYQQPEAFISSIYRFVGANENYVPNSLHQKINISEIPKSVALGKFYDQISSVLRALGLGAFLRFLRRKGLIEFFRRLNRSAGVENNSGPKWPSETLASLEKDRQELEILLGRSLDFWSSAELSRKAR